MPKFSLQNGRPQSSPWKRGDPLSVVIFNTVMNLVDTISMRIDLGYKFSNSSRKVTILQYADDTCLVANSPASCQHLLSMISDWLQWSGMVAKVPVHLSAGLHWEVGRPISPAEWDGHPFLHKCCAFPRNESPTICHFCKGLQGDTPLSRKQKVMMYRGGVCPHIYDCSSRNSQSRGWSSRWTLSSRNT